MIHLWLRKSRQREKTKENYIFIITAIGKKWFVLFHVCQNNEKLKIEKNKFFLACHVVVAGLPILADAAKARLYVWLILEICCAFIALWKCKKEKKNKTKQKIHVEKSSLNLCCHFFLSRLSSWCGHCRLYFSKKIVYFSSCIYKFVTVI